MLLVLTFPALTLSAHAQRWIMRIELLRSTISDLEVVTGVEPEYVRDEKVLFRVKEGNLFLGISVGNCKETSWGAWDVPKDTILDVEFYPGRQWKPSRLGLTKSGMTKGHNQGHETYDNAELGVYYATEFGFLRRLNLYPSIKLADLKCASNRSGKNPS